MTHRDETVTLGSSRLRVHYQLDVIDLAKRLKDSAQHVLGDVKVQRPYVEPHRTDWILWGHHWRCIRQPVLFRLCRLHRDRDAQQPLTRETHCLERECEELETSFKGHFNRILVNFISHVQKICWIALLGG